MLSLAELLPTLSEIRYPCSQALRTLPRLPKVPSTVRHSSAGTAGRSVVEKKRNEKKRKEFQCDRAKDIERFIVDPFHVEAGEGVRTCMATPFPIW